MLNKIIEMYKAGSYNELIMIGQVMNAIMTTFAQEKFKNGESDRDAAIDTLCELLQSHKSNGQNPL